MVDEHTLEVEVAKQQGINALFAALSARNIQVLSLRNKTNRLEQLFLHLVANSKTAGGEK